jgi:hypothetical protein
MSIQAAWRFIQLSRSDGDLRAAIETSAPDLDLADLVAMGAARGLTFSAEDLRAAHRNDWQARWLHRERLEKPAD